MGLWHSDVKKVEIEGLEEWDEKKAVQDGEKKDIYLFPTFMVFWKHTDCYLKTLDHRVETLLLYLWVFWWIE